MLLLPIIHGMTLSIPWKSKLFSWLDYSKPLFSFPAITQNIYFFLTVSLELLQIIQEKQMCFSKKQIRCDWSTFTDSFILSFGSLLDHFTSHLIHLYTFYVVSWMASFMAWPKLYDRHSYSLILSEVFEIPTNQLSHLFDPQHDVLLVLADHSGWPKGK